MNDNPGVHKIELHQPKKAFAIIPNRAVRDPKLTANSFRLLAYLLSHNDGYELTYRQIEKQTSLGRYAINAASKQLTERGWLRVEQTKLANGQFGPKSWTLLTPGDDEPTAGEPVAGQSAPDGFHSGTARGLKKTKPKENKQVEKTNSKNSYSPDELQRLFDEFWQVYPLKRGRGAAAKAYEKALEKIEPDELLNKATAFAGDKWRPDDFTPLATTWLNQERWDDEPYRKRDQDKTNSERNIENLRASMALLENNQTKEVESNESSRSESAVDLGINFRSTEDI